ncbi:MAG: hypothetical protein WA743_02705 [Pseudolabrys sp.]|jgi:hypothetical protein
MSKIVSLVFAATLTVLAVSFWFKTSVTETAAGARPDRATTVSVYDLHRKADMNSMPATKIDDRSIIFTAP